MIYKQLIKDKMALTGLVIITAVILIAILAPVITPNDPYAVNMSTRLQKPNPTFPLGTDELGRCLLSRIIYGTQVSLTVAGICLVIILLISVLVGILSGYIGGWFDNIIMRIIDMFMAIPDLVLTLAIVAVLGPSLINVIIGMVSVRWINYSRIIRGMVLSVKNTDYVTAARALGVGHFRIMFMHILPNVISPIIVMATLDMGNLIISLAGFSFLGLGAQPPTPEWGMMLNEGRKFIMTNPNLMLYPGLAILIVVVAFNLLGDGLRDVMDPRYSKLKINS